MPFSKRFYGGKRYFGSPSPEPLSDSLWGWIWPIITYKEPKIIASAGLDTAIYLRVLTFGVELFFWVGLWALVSLLPINLTDDYVDVLMDTQAALANSTNSTNTTSTALYTFTDFDKVGLANVSSSSARMWMHVFSCYVTTLITLWLLFRYSKESVLLRIMFLANSIPGRSSHTVLVTDIPAIAGDTRRKKRDISMQRMSQSSSRGNKIAPSPSVDDAAALTPVERLDADNPTDNQPDAEAYGKPSKDNDANEPLMDDHPERDATAPEPQVEAPPSVLRQRRRYNYQLNYSESKKLDPHHQAEAALKDGMTPKGMVTAEFEHVYSSGAVANLEMVCNQAMLRPLVTEYDRRVQQLDDLVDMCAFRIEKGVTKKLKPPQVTLFMPLHGKWGRDTFGGGLFKKVDAFEFLTKRLQELEIRIQEEQPLSAQMNWPSAFVTFSTRLNQAVCSTSLHHHDTSTWLTQPAPEPYELIWQNLGMSTSMRGALTALMWVAFWVMTLFFMVRRYFLNPQSQ